MWILITSLAAFGVVAALFVESHVLGKEHTETKTGLKNEKGQDSGSV